MKLVSMIVAASLTGMVGTVAWAQTPPPPPSGATAPSPAPSRAALGSACKADIETLCPGIQPGGGRLGECFRTNFAKLSPGCKSAIRESRAERQSSSPQPMRPATATPPPQG